MAMYKAKIYVEIEVPDNVTLNDVGNNTEKKDAEFVAEQVVRQIGDEIHPLWNLSERNYWIGNAELGGIASKGNWEELIKLG